MNKYEYVKIPQESEKIWLCEMQEIKGGSQMKRVREATPREYELAARSQLFPPFPIDPV